MSAFEGFLQGFLGRTTEIIGERKDKAENYFDQSVERARTVGQEQLRQRMENQQAMLSVANNLIQSGMPEDIVRAIANDGPGALEQAYQIYAENAAAGTQVDENFWRGVYDFSSEMIQDSDMTLEDFLGQVNGLYGSNLSATTQEGGDPFGAFVASGLGLNAMERAQERLGEYDIGGYSAADLNAMEARPSTTSPLGDTGFMGPDLTRATPREPADVYNPDPEERLRIIERFDEAVDAEAEDLYNDYQINGATDGQPLDKTLGDFRQEAAANIANTYAATFASSGIDFAAVFPELAVYLPEGFYEDGEQPPTGTPDNTITTTVLPPPTSKLSPDDPIADITIPEEVPTVETPTAPSVQEPTVFDSNETDLTLENGTVASYVGTTPSGRLRYRLEDGTFVEGTKEEVEANIASGKAQRVPPLGLGGMDTSQPLNDE